MMAKLIDIVTDIIKALGLSAAVGLILISATVLIRMTLPDYRFSSSLILTQRILLVVGALGLFIVAGLILSQSHRKPLMNERDWTRFFKCLGFTGVLLILFLGLLILAGLIDYWL